MRSALAGLIFALSSSAAFAQVGLADHQDPSRGATLLPRSVAWADGATAPVYNPAGLSHVPLAEVVYAHERSLARGQTVDGVWTAVGAMNAGLGLSLEWLRTDAGQAWRKTNLGVAFGPEALSLGAGVDFFYQSDFAGLIGLDLGVQSRFARFMSAGFTVRNLNAPSNPAAGLTLGRTYELGLGFRPFRELLSLGVDWRVEERRGFAQGRLSWSVEAAVFRGLKLFAGVSHGFVAGAPLHLQLGLTVDTAHAGVSYAASGSMNGLNHLVMARVSAGPRTGLPIGTARLLLVDLSGIGDDGPQGTLGALLGAKPESRYLRALLRLEEARTSPDVKGVVLKIEGAGVGLGRAEELRQAVLAVRAAGKPVVALILSASDADYHVATAAERVWAVHDAMLTVDGLQAQSIFLGGAMEKLKVSWDVARVGAYKNAPDQLTRQEMSPEQRETVEAYLATDLEVLEDAATKARGLTRDAWKQAVDEGLKSVRRAQELKLLDEVVTTAQAEARLSELVPGARLAATTKDDAASERWGPAPKVVVLPVLGNIAGGSDSGDPFGLATVAGAKSFLARLDQAVRDPAVKAIVVRVDSPGGDGLASDMMYRALLEARKKKPVVASMGDVAASGGYYVAAGAEEIWAQPTTITGSIGVFVLKPALAGLADSVGVRREVIRKGAQAGVFDLWEPWSDAQRASAQKWVDDFYDTFITEVATARKLKKEQVDQVARGRVWSGKDAKDKGLVDQLGGLVQAIASAKARAGLKDADDAQVVLYGGTGGLLGAVAASGGPLQSALEAPVPVSLTSRTVERLAKEVGLAELPATGRVQARMDFELRVE